MAGLIGVGQQYKNQAKQGLQQASSLEEGRKNAGEALEQAEKGMKMQAVGTGAGVGLMAAMGTGFGGSMMPAMMAGGPAGLLVGAGVGLLAAELF